MKPWSIGLVGFSLVLGIFGLFGVLEPRFIICALRSPKRPFPNSRRLNGTFKCPILTREVLPKGPSHTVFSTESDSVMWCYSVVTLLRIVIHYSKHSIQSVVIHCIFNSESLRVVNSLQIVNSLRMLFLVCQGPLGIDERE